MYIGCVNIVTGIWCLGSNKASLQKKKKSFVMFLIEIMFLIKITVAI